MKKVYVLYKKGIYGHGVHGVFTARKLAEDAADTAADQDKDCYHDWVVYKIPLNTLCSAQERKLCGFTDDLVHSKAIYKTKSTNTKLVSPV